MLMVVVVLVVVVVVVVVVGGGGVVVISVISSFICKTIGKTMHTFSYIMPWYSIFFHHSECSSTENIFFQMAEQQMWEDEGKNVDTCYEKPASEEVLRCGARWNLTVLSAHPCIQQRTE